MLLKERLAKVQVALDQATEEASKQVGITSSPRSILATPSEKDNASFLLGMDLFGKEPAALERDMRDKLSDLERELQRVLQLADTVEEEPNDFDDPSEALHDMDPQALVQKAAFCQDKINFLKQASLTRSSLDSSITLSSPALTPEPDMHQASVELVQANEYWKNAQTLLNETSSLTSTPQEQDLAVHILQTLKQDIRRQRVDLIHKACGVLDTAIQISSTALSVRKSPQLSQAYQVLQQLEGGNPALEETMRLFSDRLVRETLSAALEPHKGENATSEPFRWKIDEQEEKPSQRMIGVSTSSKKRVVHRLEWSRHEKSGSSMDIDGTGVEVWAGTFELLGRILSFVHEHILLGDTKLSQMVGERLFGKPDALPSSLHLTALGLDSMMLGNDKGKLMEEVYQLMSDTCIPNQLDASALVETLEKRSQRLTAICTPFCDTLVSVSLMPETSARKLSDFCVQLPLKYVERRRCVLLNEARQILHRCDYHNTVMAGVPPEKLPEDPSLAIFQLHQASISETAAQLMTLLRATMDESVRMPTKPETLRPSLYRTAREMLSLFRSIIPSSYSREVAQVPRTAGILHNDCVYFAHHCLTLGLEYKEKYEDEDARGKLLKQTCLFVDMVPLFRDLADKALGDMLDRQAGQLSEVVGARVTHLGMSLQSNESLLEWSEAETSLSAGLYHLNHLKQNWKPILSKRILQQSMGHLTDVVITIFWKQVTDHGRKVSLQAKHFLFNLLQNAKKELSILLEDANLEQCCTEWHRFNALVLFLGMESVADVQTALANGVFRSVAGAELSKWITANYHDSPLRQSLLHALGTTVG
eukprot:Nitzschia sp. Nitz4//scaffold276_size25055//5207//7666//NITZ4_008338-RA/size25055-processed-gene-0.10-mRNA-1//-1//CDS//3329545316//2006//frame0